MSLSGLGGVSSSSKYRHAQQSRDLPVCNEILTTVEQFKQFLAEQKKIREELVNLSQQPLIKLKDDLASMMQQVSSVTVGLRRIAVQRDRLKEDVLKEEKHVGMAQRMSETGSMSHLDNSATTEFFLNKLSEFDVRMRSYKQELEALEEHVNSQSRAYLSPKDLVVVFRQMDNEFVCLAAQLHTIYEQIKALKTRFLRNQRALGSDLGNPFAEVEASSLKIRHLDGALDSLTLGLRKTTSTTRTPYGPSPFSGSSGPSAFPLSTLATQPASGTTQPINFPSLTGAGIATAPITTSIGLGLPGLGQPTALSLGTGLASSSTATTTTPFQFNLNANTSTATTGLQKPLFGFGATASVTTPATNSLFTNTNTVGALSLAGQTFGGTTAPAMGSFGSTATSGTDSIFGKRLATKPTSLVLPKM